MLISVFACFGCTAFGSGQLAMDTEEPGAAEAQETEQISGQTGALKADPTAVLTAEPTEEPTPEPTEEPTPEPTAEPAPVHMPNEFIPIDDLMLNANMIADAIIALAK